jgi:hypothetical protein
MLGIPRATAASAKALAPDGAGVTLRRRLPAARVVACLGAFAAACIPRGDPPTGRQVVADRTSTLVGIVRPNGDGVTHVLIMRPGKELFSGDLYVVSVDAAGRPPSERLLAANIQGVGNCQHQPGECLPSDARGRVFVTTASDPNLRAATFARIDPFTGERLDFDEGAFYVRSPTGERLLVSTSSPDGQATLYEADDRVLPLGATRFGLFVGEDLYYVTAQQELMRIAPGGAPELLRTGIFSFSPHMTEGNPLLLLSRATDDPFVYSSSIFDTVTLEETPSPVQGQFSMSPDGRWLLTVDYRTGHVTLVERTTGVEESFDLPAFQFGGGNYEWRPGHTEVWFPTSQYPQTTTLIKKPGAPAVEIPGSAFTYGDESTGQASFFTRDGTYWFSSRGMPSERPIVQVGSADNPTGARFDLAPTGNTFGYRRLADGRLLVSSFTADFLRNDLYAVDPATGESQLLGEQGFVVAVGHTRLLASLHVNDSRGDLTAIGLASGRATVLAQEFAMAAFVERQGTDSVAPGAQVAFQFQARVGSPFDGIWLATVP